MALNEPLNAKAKAKSKTARSKASMIYNADDYMDELKNKWEHDHEIASLMGASPDSGGGPGKGTGDKMTDKVLNDEKRSLTTGRLWPESNKPDPMPRDIAFMFTKITPEQMMYMWRWYTGIFIFQCSCPLLYAALLCHGVHFGLATAIVGIIAWQLCIQNVYILHDVLHGATFPPYWWQNYITHCWADFFSIPWSDLVMEHMKHHSSTVDLLVHGEFGWDPSGWLYVPNEYSWFTAPLCLPWHFFGANDTGALFMCLWWFNFPTEGSGGKCNKDFWGKWFPRRVKHLLFVWWLWSCVYLLGTITPLGGLKFMLIISTMMRSGFTSAWLFIVNFNHSHTWNHFLASDPERSWEMLHSVMAAILGGRHRWNEILFHDLHHAFPNAVGTLSQRGRFNQWQPVHDAAVKILHNGLFKANGDKPTTMQTHQRKRSIIGAPK